MFHFQKNLNKLHQDKRGIHTLEVALGLLVLVVMLGFMTDLIHIGTVYQSLSQANNNLARVAGIQGGLRTTPPTGWRGGRANYMTVDDVRTRLSRTMNSVGIEDGRWQATVDGVNVRTSQTPQFAYKTSFDTVLEAQYRWEFSHAMIPGVPKYGRIRSVRPTISEYRTGQDQYIGD